MSSDRGAPREPYILIVEDERDLRDFLELLLRSYGYHTATARTGPDALALMRESPPCLVLLDLHLPGMSGWEMRERQLQDPAIADVPVVCITAMYEPEDVGRKLGLPCLGKPLEFPSVLQAVQAVCGRADT